MNMSATLNVNQWKPLKCMSIKSGTALNFNLSYRFPIAPPIIMQKINLSVFLKFIDEKNKNIITPPINAVIKL